MVASFAKATMIWGISDRRRSRTALGARQPSCLIFLKVNAFSSILGSICYTISPSFKQLYLRPPPLYQFYFTKGKGANRNLPINQRTSTSCLLKMNYSYGIAAESTSSAPLCPFAVHCPHLRRPHHLEIFYEGSSRGEGETQTLDLTKYERFWMLSNFERSEIKKMWAHRGKVTTNAPKSRKSSHCHWKYRCRGSLS